MTPTLAVRKALQPVSKKMAPFAKWCGNNLNFYRVHVLVFTFTPLIAACIFYACNGATHIKFIDSLFVCVSAMTVTGLVTINISTGNGGQQAILFILMCIGNISAVSITMIWIRRSFFRRKFDHVVRRSAKARKRMNDVEEQERRERKHNMAKIQRMMGLKSADSATTSSENGDDMDRTDTSSSGDARRYDKKRQQQKGKRKPLRADMIRRIDGPAFLINSAGDPSNTIPEHHMITQDTPQFSEEPQSIEMTGLSQVPSNGGILASPTGPDSNDNDQQQQPSIRISLPHSPGPVDPASDERDDEALPPASRGGLAIPHSTKRYDPDADSDEDEEAIDDEDGPTMDTPASPPYRTRFPGLAQQQAEHRGRRLSDPSQMHFRRGSDAGLATSYHTHEKADMFPRAQTVEFALPGDSRTSYDRNESAYTTGYGPGAAAGMRQRTNTMGRTVTGRSYMSSGRLSGARGVPLARTQTSSKQRGFGGFPTPLAIAGIAIKKAMPGVQERFSRTMTMPRTSTITSVRSGGAMTDVTTGTKSAPYLSFDATVSGNSRFHELTEAQREELGGVEYRALDLLAKLIPAYWLILNLGAVTLVAPYINSEAFAKYRPVFEAQGQYQPNYTWFWFFNVVSAYSNTGMSLIDTSMTQMRDAYFLLITMGFLILAGNTGFPIVLRFFIWTFSKIVPSRSRLSETLQFLLDHPRRCFVYLFPSSQTWFLFMVLVLFNVTDWVAFLVLDLGNPEIESIQLDIRVFDGLFQSIAVRAAGFQVVSLLTLAPAVQFLYVIMMYLSAFPLALSVRSTNVYEEKSLGVYNDEQVQDGGAIPQETDAKVWGSFLASHARRQLAFDIWWLGFALWLVCIIERDNIRDPTSNGWFTIFSCLFELTSAYGTVGLSTGTPYDNFSLSGRFHTLSKLVVCAVMIRGRHRGLPVAIDRAILLPTEQELEDMDDDDLLAGFNLGEDTEEDRDATFVEAATAPRSQGRRRSSSADRHVNLAPTFTTSSNNNGMSAVRRTQSGVSFAVSQPRRGSIGKAGTLSPKQSEFNTSGMVDPIRSFSMPPSAMPLPGAANSSVPSGMMVQPSGQLSAIDEMPNSGLGGSATPVTESRPESPFPSGAPLTDPPSFTSHAGSEVQTAAQYGCSTPNGRHSPTP